VTRPFDQEAHLTHRSFLNEPGHVFDLNSRFADVQERFFLPNIIASIVSICMGQSHWIRSCRVERYMYLSASRGWILLRLACRTKHLTTRQTPRIVDCCYPCQLHLTRHLSDHRKRPSPKATTSISIMDQGKKSRERRHIQYQTHPTYIPHYDDRMIGANKVSR
jgi:hypothetical protein